MSHRKLKGVVHGKRTSYRKGCRCTACCQVEQVYQREKRRKHRAAQGPSSRYVQRWERRVVPPDADVTCYRREKARHAAKDAKRVAAAIAAAKAQLAREMDHALVLGKGGRPRKQLNPHIPCLSEAA